MKTMKCQVIFLDVIFFNTQLHRCYNMFRCKHLLCIDILVNVGYFLDSNCMRQKFSKWNDMTAENQHRNNREKNSWIPVNRQKLVVFHLTMLMKISFSKFLSAYVTLWEFLCEHIVNLIKYIRIFTKPWKLLNTNRWMISKP